MVFTKNKWAILLCGLLLSLNIYAQTTIFTGATIHIGNGKVIEHGVLAIDGKKIIYIGQEKDGATFKDAKLIDVTGKHIYPGLINAHCKVGLNEIDAARATLDFAEVGEMNPNVRSQIAFNSDSKIIPTLRFNGVLFVQPTPVGRVITGTSAIMDLSGENWEEATVVANDGVHLNWKEHAGISQPNDESYKQFYSQLISFFDQAQAYCKLSTVTEKNVKFEAMRKVFSGEINLYIEANTSRGMKQAVEFSELYEIKPVIVGGNESHLITEFLKQHNIAIILNKLHRLPDLAGEEVNLPFQLPGILKKAGIRFCISVEGSWEVRNLAFNAGTAAAWGLTQEEALSAITSDAASILKVNQFIGSIETNKQASFVVCNGDILDMKGNQMTYIYINGKSIPVEAMQQELYQKYHQKYFNSKGE